MDPIIPIIIVLAVCLVVVGIIYSSLQAKKRREDLARLASQWGWRFDAQDPFDIANRYAGFGILSAGHNRSASNVLHGSRGTYAFKAFDFLYYTTETSTDSQGHVTTREQSHYLSAIVADIAATFPQLLIRPEGFFDKIAAAIGFDDINFESAEFSRKFYVKAGDKKFAYDVIHPRMMEFLLKYPRWTLELRGRGILACNGRLLKPEQYPEVVELMEGFLQRIPDYVWEQLRGK